jgi:hypothetical protein
VKINVFSKVLQVLDKISYLGVTLDLGNLEFFRQTIACHPSGEGYTGAQQESVHHGHLSLILSLHLLGHVGALFLQIINRSTQISSIFLTILSEIDPLIVSSRVVIFLVILLVKVIFVVITVVSTAAMLLLPMRLSVYLGMRRPFWDSEQQLCILFVSRLQFRLPTPPSSSVLHHPGEGTMEEVVDRFGLLGVD